MYNSRATDFCLPSDAKSKHAQLRSEQIVSQALELGVMPDHIGGPGKQPTQNCPG